MKKNSIEKLFELAPYEQSKNKGKIFNAAVIDELNFHISNNSLYKKFFDKKNGLEKKIKSLSHEKIPFVPVQIFKELGGLLSSVNKRYIKKSLESSATSGRPSKIFIDRETSRRQIKAMSKVLGSFIGMKRRPFHIMDVNPIGQSNTEITARGAATIGFLNFASESNYYISSKEDGALKFNLDNFEEHFTLKNNTEPPIIFGFTYVLYFSVIKKLIQNGKSFSMPKGTKVIHIGGWKKLESEKVSKKVFNKDISEVFGIEKQDIIDIYGFTEQMGIIYPDCKYGLKHTSVFSEVIVRDPVTHEVIKDGSSGLLQFLSPIPHSYPGNSVLTDDIGRILSRKKCKCGRSGTSFQIIGRAKKAEIRGCGDIMATKIFDSKKSVIKSTDSNIIVNYYYGMNILSEKNYNNNDILNNIFKKLFESKQWLIKQDVDSIIRLIGKAREKWMDDSFELGNYRKRGLDFLISWTDPSNLKELADFSLNGQRGYLDSFRPLNDSTRRLLKANPKGIIGHWLSGNVPILGLLTIIQGIITKNVNILKVASSYSDVIPILLKSFEDIEIRTSNSNKLKGSDLLNTIAVIYFNKDNTDAGKIMSNNCDVRLVWGGNEAVNSISGLPRKVMSDDIIFGPKLSFMAIGKDSFNSERLFKKITRKAATDISVFDQTACASPHTIFVEDGGNYSAYQFAEKLAIEMEKTLYRIPIGEVDKEREHLISSKRALYEFIGNVWSSENSEWTVLYDKNFELAEPIYSRTITVRPVKDIMKVVEFASDEIQTIGLSLQGSQRLDFAKIVSSKGVERCPDIGLMTHFENPWDGEFVMQKMIRWSTLGGP